MTPKEKALELYFNYHNLWINGNSIMAKQCALIAVNELIEHSYQVMKPFWQEVKQEIELL
jgi:hypothetical protein